jgi:hypothetical protein
MVNLKLELQALRSADPQDRVQILDSIIRDFSRRAIAKELASERPAAELTPGVATDRGGKPFKTRARKA